MIADMNSVSIKHRRRSSSKDTCSVVLFASGRKVKQKVSCSSSNLLMTLVVVALVSGKAQWKKKIFS